MGHLSDKIVFWNNLEHLVNHVVNYCYFRVLLSEVDWDFAVQWFICRGAYCAVTVARLTGIATPEMFDSTAEWIVRYVAPNFLVY